MPDLDDIPELAELSPPIEPASDADLEPEEAVQVSGSRTVSERIRFEEWGKRGESRFGRGVHANNGQCSLQLSFGQGADDEVVIRPSEPLVITGNGMAEWRLAKEDQDAELIVRVTSKPATRWQWIVQVGARSNPGAAPTRLAPGDAVTVLDKLQIHARWLQESLESPLPNSRARMPGMPDSATYRRWLRSQQRDTEKAIRHWGVILELCEALSTFGEIDMELSIAPPSHPP
jgi:hypothetical protein